ncbi:hypothetical protein EG329_010674 [Mollisiaceae sp. DMI_Dod_QoI]|nr:hypothetical protein EG329_010674 [Helotiales sp. DMI_Dod_QoI]
MDWIRRRSSRTSSNRGNLHVPSSSAPRGSGIPPEILEETISGPTNTEHIRVEKHYKYQKLDYDNDIRILRILHGKKGDPLKCMLFPSALKSTKSRSKSNCHEFCVLSYYPDFDKLTYPVIIYDDVGAQEGLQTTTSFNSAGSLYIGTHLATALQRLRKENEDVNMWVEALCINPVDIFEWDDIARRRERFSQANSVFVRLEAGNQKAKETFDFLKHILDLNVADDLVKTRAQAEKLMLVIDLLNYRWFNGIGQLQDVAWARNAVIFWGSEQMQWSDFAGAISLFMSKYEEIKEILGDSYCSPNLIEQAHYISSQISREMKKRWLRNQSTESTESTSKHESEGTVPKIMSGFEDTYGAENDFLLEEADRSDPDLETLDNKQQIQILPPEQKDDIFHEQNDGHGDRNNVPIKCRLHLAQQPAVGLFSISSISSKLWNYIFPKKLLAPGIVRLEWTCSCGHTSHDDTRELRPGAVADYATKLVQSGYVTRAQPTNHASGATATFITAARNKVTAVGRNIPGFESSTRGQRVKLKRRKFAAIQCSSTPGITCRWLHLCLKPRPNARVTKLEPLHICKNDEAKDLTDATFFKFSAFPDDSVDRIVADMVPSTTEHYEFAPPPPLEMVPPIAAEHMVHLLLSECTPSMQHSSFYLEQLPKKKDKPLKFAVGAALSQDINVGYGLRFIEKPDPSFIVTFLFVTAIVVGTVFGAFWTVFKKDLQGAWTVSAYIVSVVALAVVTWQIRAIS